MADGGGFISGNFPVGAAPAPIAPTYMGGGGLTDTIGQLATLSGLPGGKGLLSRAVGENQSQRQAQSTNQSQNQATSDSFIPDYSQTPILERIAQYAEGMAPQVYNWGMEQFNKNQGNIDNLMRAGQEWASPAHIATRMGQAEAGVQQAGETARLSAMKDLQSYGIDPSAGRYAALDNASRVQTAAAAAGAGNQQRDADIAQGLSMQNQAMSAGLQNNQVGYGAANAMNDLLGTGMSLKYSPLGTTSQSTGYTTGQSTDVSSASGFNLGAAPSVTHSTSDPVKPSVVPGWGPWQPTQPSTTSSSGPAFAEGGPVSGYDEGGPVRRVKTSGPVAPTVVPGWGPWQPTEPYEQESSGPGFDEGGPVEKFRRGGRVRGGKVARGRGRGPKQRPPDDQNDPFAESAEAAAPQPTGGPPKGAAPVDTSGPGLGTPGVGGGLGPPPPSTTPVAGEPAPMDTDEGYARGGPVDPIASEIESETGKPRGTGDERWGPGGFYGSASQASGGADVGGEGSSMGGMGAGGGEESEDTGDYAGGGVVGTTSSGFTPTPSVPAPAGYTSAPAVRGFAGGGGVTGATTGGFVSQALSPSNGHQVDDVPARLNEGEYVIPRDVVHWKGKDFFHKLIAQSRKNRAAHGAPSDDRGYNMGGPVADAAGFYGGAI